MIEHDLVIRGGTVLDGTGRDRFDADVAITDGRVAAIGQRLGRGREELDARDAIVSPGWVDIHTHYDGQVTWDPDLTPSSWHGVTTAVMGNCGVGFAPVRPGLEDWLIALMEGVEDIPGAALHEGISWGWESFPEYLDAVGARPLAIDVATQVPHTALRGYVMGERGADHTAMPNPSEIAEMGRLAAEAILAGALGFSTSRTVAHRSSDGRPTPSLTASPEELLGICSAVGSTGTGVLEVVADLDDLVAESRFIAAMAEVSGRPTSLTTLQRRQFPADEYTRILALLEDGAAAGLPLWGQVAARPVGIIMSLEGRIHPLVPSPTYGRLAALPLGERVAVLRNDEVRERIVAEVSAEQGGHSPLEQYRRAFKMTDPPCYDPPPQASLAAEAERRGIPVAAVAYEALLADDGKGLIYTPAANYLAGDMRAVREMLVHPRTVPGLGDAGAHCTMISDGSFPTFLLAYWGLGAPESERLPLEWIVKQQAADTAALVGLRDRGALAPGYRADVNIIDPDALGVGLPEMRADLPAGGQRLVQNATGYRATLVAGVAVTRDGVLTGNRPGTLVRGAQRPPKS